MKKSKKIYKTIICTRISSQKNNNNMYSNSLPINKRESNLLGYDVFVIYLLETKVGMNMVFKPLFPSTRKK